MLVGIAQTTDCFFLTLCFDSSVCQQRGRRNCGLNAFYCYDEFTENWECQCELGFENKDPNRGPEFSCTGEKLETHQLTFAEIV